ncbi:hypothetical protein Tco_1127376 [Tanacetum coccineum]
MNTAVAHPQANGLVERANKSLMYGLKSKAVIPAEIDMPNYQTIQFNETRNEEEMRLIWISYKKEGRQRRSGEVKYKKKVVQYYNKRVRHVSFRVEDFVYRRNEAN